MYTNTPICNSDLKCENKLTDFRKGLHRDCLHEGIYFNEEERIIVRISETVKKNRFLQVDSQ